MKQLNTTTYTDVEMLCFLLRMNEIGELSPYISLTNEEIEEIFMEYHELLKNDESHENSEVETETISDDNEEIFTHLLSLTKERRILLKYHDILTALLQLELEMPEPTEQEIKQLEQFILNMNDTNKTYLELTEQEMQEAISIMNGKINDETSYHSYVMNAFSYVWKSSEATMDANRAQKKLEKLIKLAIIGIWISLSYIHYQQEAYLNMVGDISTIPLYLMIFYIKENEEDNYLKNAKIAYILKWMRSCGILTGLQNNQLSITSFVLLIAYHIVAKSFEKQAMLEKEKQKIR